MYMQSVITLHVTTFFFWYDLIFQHVPGLVQERPHSIANTLEYVFLALTHRYVHAVSH